MSSPSPSAREAFRTFLSALAEIPDEAWRDSADLLVAEHYAPNQVIARHGEVCDRVRFLVSGLARSWVIDSGGREFTWCLHFGGDGADFTNRLLIDYASFTQAEPSRLTLEALTDVEVISIRKSDVECTFSGSLLWATVGRLIAQRAYYYTHHRVISLLTRSAKERYLQLFEESPGLLKIAPQHYIASYLGITPQSLSRLRRELALPNVNDLREGPR